MPIKFECPRCGQKLSVADDRAGRSVRCPQCKATAQVPANEPAPLSLDDAEALPSPAESDYEDDRDAPPRRRSDDRDERYDEEDEEFLRAARRKSKWNGIASGISGLQVGLIVLALAESLLVAAPFIASAGKPSAESLQMFINLLLFSFLTAVASSTCFCFGHMSGSSAPEPGSKKLALWSLAVSTFAILFWILFIGSFIYLRMRIVHLAEHPNEAVWVVRVIGGSFILAVVTVWSAELVFLRLLRRVAVLFENSKLLSWANGVFLALAILLGLFVLMMGYYIMQVNRDVRVSEQTTRTEARVIVFSIYGVTMMFLACYFWTLMLAKRVLYGKDKSHNDDDR